MHEGDEDPFVPVWEGPTPEAFDVRRRIESAHIPVQDGDALLVGHTRLEVPQSYIEEVRDALAGDASDWPMEVSDEWDGNLDYRPLVRLALVIVAIGLLLVILFV